MSGLAFPIVLGALALTTAWVVGAVALPGWALVARRWPVLARTALLAATLPALAALGVLLAGLLPGDPHLGSALGCHCSASMPAWLHLCPVHPAAALELVPPALGVLALGLWRPLRGAGALLREPTGQGMDRLAVTLVPLPEPTAVLVGWRFPSLAVDPRLWQALDPAGRDALLAHEQAHADRRDPALWWLLRGLTLLAPAFAAEALLRTWRQRAEVQSDALAARAVGDPLLVAETLLHCARLGLRGPTSNLAWTGGSLDDRVARLLTGSPAPSHRGDVGWRDFAVLGTLAAAVLGATPWVHHHVEHLLNLSL